MVVDNSGHWNRLMMVCLAMVDDCLMIGLGWLMIVNGALLIIVNRCSLSLTVFPVVDDGNTNDSCEDSGP